MSTEKASILALAPFIRIFTYAIIKSIRSKNLSGERYILHSDMVPKITERVMLASMQEKTNIPAPNSMVGMVASISVSPKLVEVPKPLEQKPNSSMPIVNPPLFSQPSTSNNLPLRTPPRVMPRQNAPPVQQMEMPVSVEGEGAELTQFYGKISPLLGDPSVSVIECPGMGKPVFVIRRGQRQLTKIILGEKDIEQILQKISDAAHIPLMEGVFRAAVDTFSVNAVISEIIGGVVSVIISIVQVSEHPSPLMVFPSSHSSPRAG